MGKRGRKKVGSSADQPDRPRRRRKRKNPSGLWLGAPPAALAVVACFIFGSLIITGLGVRLLVVRYVSPAESDTGEADEQTSDLLQSDVNLFPDAARITVPNSQLSDKSVDAVPLSQLSTLGQPNIPESRLSAVPAPAAARKDRKLPGILYVGDRPEMFGELNEALLAMIPGDVIEIRTNRILPLIPIDLTGGEQQQPAPLDQPPVMIRAANGFYPLIRAVETGPLIRVNDRSIWLRGLHISGADAVFDGSGLDIAAQLCSLTDGTLLTGDDLNGRASRVQVDRCIFRYASLSDGNPSVTQLGIYRTLYIGSMHRHSMITAGSSRKVEILNSTFLHSGVLKILNGGQPGTGISFRMQNSIALHLACCPRLISIGTSIPLPESNTQVPQNVFRASFNQFELNNNYLSFHDPNLPGGWGLIESTSSRNSAPLQVQHFPLVESQLIRPTGSERLGAASTAIWDGDPATTDTPLLRQITREDAVMSSEDPVVNTPLQNRRIGCPAELLPLVPPEASVTYELATPENN